jgi:hypothetical protein
MEQMHRSALPDQISSSLIGKVLQQAQSTASHSWEYGVVFEALLEYHDPRLTVFHTPVSQHQKQTTTLTEEVEALEYIKPYLRTNSITLCEGNGKTALHRDLRASNHHLQDPQPIQHPSEYPL